MDTQTHKFILEECSAVKNCLENLAQVLQVPGPTGTNAAPISLALSVESSSVMILTHAIMCYGIPTDDLNKWRYYLDSVEVYLPPFWEQYINDENAIELIHTDSLSLVISLDGRTPQEYIREIRGYALQPVPSAQASTRGKKGEQTELLNICKKTHEGYALSRPYGLCEALPIVASFMMFLFCLITLDVFAPWLVGGTLLLLGAGLWRPLAPPAKFSLREIHCLRDTPRCWGSSGENDQEQISNIPLDTINLVYLMYWQPYTTQNLDQQTDTGIYLDRHVMRRGRYPSLYNEVKSFPLQCWLHSMIIAAGSLLALSMLLFWIPLDMPLKFTFSWVKDVQTIEAISVKQLADVGMRVGDILCINGTGMCNIRTSGIWSVKTNPPFLSFDCLQIIWNDARSLPLLESELVDKVTISIEAVNRQLHPEPENELHVSALLRLAIQKSDMVLLDDFGDTVLKTANLCSTRDDCVRLRNALINFGSNKG